MFKKSLVIFTVLFVVVLMSGCGKQEDINNQNQNAEQLLQENQTQEIENKEELSEIENKEQIEENLEEIFQDENGEMMKRKKITAKFSIVYPADWFWIDEPNGFGEFLTNNSNIKNLEANNLNDFNDVIVTVTAQPLAPYSENITNIVERLEYEIKDDINYGKDSSCAKVVNPEFDVEYECQNNVDGAYYYYSKIIGLDNSDTIYSSSKRSITAKSKNPELIKKFSIEKNY